MTIQVGDPIDSGHARLHELGYKQELKRDLSVLSNFAFSFCVVSVITGLNTLYGTGLSFGGPISFIYGWLIAGTFTMFVGLSMAEICSSYPTSGGLYYWSAKLAGPSWAPFASWITGWFNVIGQWAVTTSVDFSLAQLIQVMILLGSGGKNGGGYEASKYVVMAMHGGILFSHAILNSLPISLLSFLGQFAAAWNVLGVFLLMILIPTVATERASAKFVFTNFNTDNGDGIHNNVYIFVLGLLMSQYTLTGYDASALMTEETKNADVNGPKGIISAIGISLLAGWCYLLGITFAVTDIPHLLDSDNDAGGYAIAQIFYDAFKSRYGSGTGAIVCLGIIAVAVYFCGMSSLTSNSRMAYAFSRDGAMPFSQFWHKVNRHEVPINAVWASSLIAFCMALTSLGSLVAFQAMTSIATIGLYIAYALPSLFRVTLARNSFVPGPFNLGRYGVIVGWIAVLWVATISVLFSLPVAYPITDQTLNYTPVAVGGLLILVVSSWIVSARHWFKGPITNIDSSSNEDDDFAEEFEPLFDYHRVQPFNVVCLDDDSLDSPPVKQKPSNVSAATEDNDKGFIQIVDCKEKDEDWLLSPPMISFNAKSRAENSTLREIRYPLIFQSSSNSKVAINRLRKQELASFTESAKDVLQAVEESVKRDLGASLQSSVGTVTEQESKPTTERAKIIISIQDKDETKQFRIYMDDKFERLFKLYADKMKLDLQKLVFCFDGEKIKPTATPDSLEMEDNDIIEVHLKPS
nr:amino-acid permease BAT1 homolog [Ipomoea trifida]